VIWYNGFYTYLKRITPYAVVPGSLVGAIPVFMGWSAAGGNLWDISIIFIAFFLFIWQVPHFWLLMQKYGEEYKAAGFPTINESIRPHKFKIIIFFWIVATSLSSLMIPFFLPQLSKVFFILIFVLNLLFISIFARLSFGVKSDLNLKKSFISINVYMLLFMLILIIYHLV
jgi:protoheme IX farnesyltransferase